MRLSTFYGSEDIVNCVSGSVMMSHCILSCSYIRVWPVSLEL